MELGSVNGLILAYFYLHTEPPMIQNVTVDRLSDSEMNVSWVLLTVVEARGFLGNYTITYSRVEETRRKRQVRMTVEVPSYKSTVIIRGLEAGVVYEVTVTAQTSAGFSPGEEVVTFK